MRTTDKMTTIENLAKAEGWTLVNWDAVYEAACDSVDQGLDLVAGISDDEDLYRQIQSSISDAVTNAWHEGLSHDEWVSAALRRMR